MTYDPITKKHIKDDVYYAAMSKYHRHMFERDLPEIME